MNYGLKILDFWHLPKANSFLTIVIFATILVSIKRAEIIQKVRSKANKK